MEFGERHLPRTPFESYYLPLTEQESFRLEVENTAGYLEWTVSVTSRLFMQTSRVWGNLPGGQGWIYTDVGDPIDDLFMVAYPRGIINTPVTPLIGGSGGPFAKMFHYNASDPSYLPADGMHTIGWQQLLQVLEVRARPNAAIAEDTAFRTVITWHIQGEAP